MDDNRSGDPGRRAEDKRYANIQAQLATTKQTILTLQESVEALKDELKEYDASLYGGHRDRDSISFRLKQVENSTQELHRVVIGDEGGNGGIKKMVQGLNNSVERMNDRISELFESKKERVTRLSAVWVAIATSAGLVFSNLDKLADGAVKFSQVWKSEPLSAQHLKEKIAELKKTRGPEVEKMLKEIEREQRKRQ